MAQYYTYVLINSLDNQPFYVGKGSGSRMYQHLKEAVREDYTKRSVHCKIQNIIQNGGRILYQKIDMVTEQQAFDEEKRLIALYGRKDAGTGLLCNLTDGGEGSSNQCAESIERRAAKHRGMKRSDQSKTRMKRAQKKIAAHNREQYGTGVKPETITKMSQQRRGKKWSDKARAVVRNKPTAKAVLVHKKITGEFIGEWESVSLCAKSLCCDTGQVWKVLSGYQTRTPDGILRTCKSHKGYTFQYKENGP